MNARRLFVDLCAIASWILLWAISARVGWELGEQAVGPEGLEGYGFMTGVLGVLFLSPLGLWCSTFFLWKKRRVILFVLCGVPVGLAITSWPLLPLPEWLGVPLVILVQVVPLGALLYWLWRHR